MNKFLQLFLFLFVFCVSASSIQAQSEVEFFDGSFEKMTAQAKTQNKHYMVFFTKDNCIPCIKMEEDTFTDPTLIKLAKEKLFVFEANMPETNAMSLAQEYGITAYPCLLIFSPEGNLTAKLLGFQSPQTLISITNRLMN
ncbi:MAG: thioredoxin family protein [Bacteroidia bacterium]